jgi:hypothetical protein
MPCQSHPPWLSSVLHFVKILSLRALLTLIHELIVLSCCSLPNDCILKVYFFNSSPEVSSTRRNSGGTKYELVLCLRILTSPPSMFTIIPLLYSAPNEERTFSWIHSITLWPEIKHALCLVRPRPVFMIDFYFQSGDNLVYCGRRTVSYILKSLSLVLAAHPLFWRADYLTSIDNI